MFSGRPKYSSGACTAFAECAASVCLAAPVENGEGSPRRRKLSAEHEEGARNQGYRQGLVQGNEMLPPASCSADIIPPTYQITKLAQVLKVD